MDVGRGEGVMLGIMLCLVQGGTQMGKMPGCVRATSETFLCSLCHRSIMAQRATQRFVLSILAFPSFMRGKKPPFTGKQTEPAEG